MVQLWQWEISEAETQNVLIEFFPKDQTMQTNGLRIVEKLKQVED